MFRLFFEILFILYLIRMVMRLFSPSRFEAASHTQQRQQDYYRQQDQYRQQEYYRQQQQQEQARQQEYARQQQRAKDGSIKIDHIPQQKKNQVPDSEGDFIDFEEIK